MTEKLEKLKEKLGEISDIAYASSVLSWDQQVNMPPGGNEARGHQLATLSKIAQEKLISDEVGRLIDDLKQEFDGADTDEAALVRVAARNYDKAKRVPPSYIAERAIVTARAFEAWKEARSKSDFSIFQPHLERVVELIHKYVSFFPEVEHPYDALLDDYERGMKTADVKAIFDGLRPRQVELIKAISAAKPIKDDFLYRKYNEKKLMDFGEEVITKFGYDWNRGRQDKAPHPFQTSFSVNDVRITTRFEDDNPMATLFSTMHEAGHAMYEQGSNQAYERTPLAGGTSLAVHESQSRLWENLVGRSLPFWKHFYPALKRRFAAQLDGVGLKAFYKAINKVTPSLIRVNADEATYNLHIMLRLELEIGMVEGSLPIRDLPEIWNTKFQEYLGITPPNEAKGVLQDIHWSSGYIGYFSTYALGNLISAQLWERINEDLPNLSDQIGQGNFSELLAWLRKNIHHHGQKYEPQTLVEMVTGSRIRPEPYVRYLTEKYSEIYGL
jgi:carboxypeptidase Taq